MSKSFEFIIDNGQVKENDPVLFFGDRAGNVPDLIFTKPEKTMLDILVECGIFPSKGQARKNGWAGKENIPDGYSEVIVGKMKRCIAIFKPQE